MAIEDFLALNTLQLWKSPNIKIIAKINSIFFIIIFSPIL